MKKIIKGPRTPQVESDINSLLVDYKSYAATALSGLGRTITEDGNLVNRNKGKNHSTTTDRYDVIHEDVAQDIYYIMHPDAKPQWEEQYRDGLKAILAGYPSLIPDFEFIPTLSTY